MKHLTLAIALLFVGNILKAQDCSFLDKLDKGDQWTYTTFNAKGKKQSDSKYTITDKQNNDTLTLGVKVVNKTKDKEYTGQYNMLCYNGVIFMDMERFISTYKQNMTGMDFEMTADRLEIPASLKVGDTLAPASVNMKAGMNGMIIMKVSITIKDRKVVGRDTITTAAGTFECLVIEQTTLVSFGARVRESSSKDYFSKSHGTIRSETYNKKGKLTDYLEMTEVSF